VPQRCEGPDSLYNVVQSLLIVTPIVLGLATIAFAFLCRKLYRQFGWAEFHLVGASPEMKRESSRVRLGSLYPKDQTLFARESLTA
jgi:hypothetical protein